VTWKIVIGPEAEAEITQSQDWYDQRSPGLGADFVAAIRSVLAAIAANPFQYQIVWDHYRRAVLHRFPHLVIYVVSDDVVRVIACVHGQRAPEIWQQRADET
jgi:toxin ParE1/3/4